MCKFLVTMTKDNDDLRGVGGEMSLHLIPPMILFKVIGDGGYKDYIGIKTPSIMDEHYILWLRPSGYSPLNAAVVDHVGEVQRLHPNEWVIIRNS